MDHDLPMTTLWIGFNLFVLLMLALDLGVFHRSLHAVKVKEAMIWSGVWILLATIFGGAVWHFMGNEKGLEFFTGYLVEKSLSVDNIFIFILVFSSFQVPAKYQHKILFWGILGALVMRAVFIFAGIALIEKFHWVIYLFGAFLIFTGIRMARPNHEEPDLEKSAGVRFARRLFSVTTGEHGGKFFVTENGKRHVTRFFLALIVIEVTDLIFAVDSIPAILAISQDSFIVYTSNVFAILGLRSLYFALAHLHERFTYLKYGLAAVLCFVGTKMLIVDIYKVPTLVSLAVVFSVLTISVIISLKATEKRAK
jgi:tellurite resistance protein TerC